MFEQLLKQISTEQLVEAFAVKMEQYNDGAERVKDIIAKSAKLREELEAIKAEIEHRKNTT